MLLDDVLTRPLQVDEVDGLYSYANPKMPEIAVQLITALLAPILLSVNPVTSTQGVVNDACAKVLTPPEQLVLTRQL